MTVSTSARSLRLGWIFAALLLTCSPAGQADTTPPTSPSPEATNGNGAEIKSPDKLPPNPDELAEQGPTVEVALLLKIVYDANGKVIDASIEKSSGDPSRDAAAVAAAKTWHINPGTKNGRRVGGEARVPVTFRMPAPEPAQ